MVFGIRIKSATIYIFLYFFILAIIGSILLKLPVFYVSNNSISFIDCLFTTVSAICVTGLSTVDMSVFSNAGFFMIMVLIELGGLGLVAFFTIYLLFAKNKISLVNQNFVHDFFTKEAKTEVTKIIAKIILAVIIFQLLGALILALFLKHYGEKNYIFYSLFLSVSAFCNAGFTPYSDSLVQFSDNSIFCLIIAILIICGGLGFFVLDEIAQFLTKKKKNLSLHTKIVLAVTLFLIFGGTIIIFFADKNNAFKNMNTFESLSNAFFQSVTLRTAGFETVAQKNFSPLTAFISIPFMLTGGSPGSMAGGLKTTSVFLLIFYVYKSAFDKGGATIFKRDIASEAFTKAMRVFIKGICLVFLMFCFLLIAEDFSLKNNIFTSEELFFEAISAFGTVGLSKGITGNLSFNGKIIIIIMMFAGRTGITFITLESFSRKKHIKSLTDYPEEDILIG